MNNTFFPIIVAFLAAFTVWSAVRIKKKKKRFLKGKASPY